MLRYSLNQSVERAQWPVVAVDSVGAKTPSSTLREEVSGARVDDVVSAKDGMLRW